MPKRITKHTWCDVPCLHPLFSAVLTYRTQACHLYVLLSNGYEFGDRTWNYIGGYTYGVKSLAATSEPNSQLPQLVMAKLDFRFQLVI